jgi:heat-inducible transcriptional repressor
MAFENLSEREKEVLANLVNYYISTADPVGSRVIANKFHMGVSSATIRNTLQDLEELGLVEQPHTSAGRVPTDIGYRVYVDYLVKPEHLTAAEKSAIKQSILREGRGIHEILGQTTKVLGEITHQLGVSLIPKFDDGVLKSLKLIPISEGRLMVVVVVAHGLVHSVILEIEAVISDRELGELESLLNERLAGLTLSTIRKTVSERLEGISGNPRLIQLVLNSREKIWADHGPEPIHLAGTENLLVKPEFADRDKLTQLVKLLENGKVLTEFLNQAADEGLVITIGRENSIAEIMNCSLVTTRYRVGNITGTIGVIGPTRMPYGKLVSVVEYTARSITEVLSGLDEKQGKA